MRSLYLFLALASACLVLPGMAAGPEPPSSGPYGAQPSGPQPRQGGVVPPSPDVPADPARTREVILSDNQFRPSLTVVRAGAVVIWRNKDHHAHTVTFPKPPPGVDSGPLAPGGEYRLSFGRPGTYPYYCRIHGREMDGTVVVEER